MSAKSPSLRIHHTEPLSRANGPGARAVIWVQGCTLGCPGCFNPETHARGGQTKTVAELVRWVQTLRGKIEGLSISGGEPLQQLNGLLPFLEQVRQETDLSVVLFSGYSWGEIQQMPQAPQLLAQIDVLLAGRYDASQRVAHGLLGSSNKTVHFLSSRYTPADLETVPEAEVILTDHGEIIFSGINPLQWE
jgi:anaerobic ribonucleoside-triphosphate reductase activating protein